MKLGIVSNAYFRFDDYEEGLDKLKSHGYSFFDYSELIAWDSPLYNLSDGELKDYLEKVKTTAKSKGISPSQVHGPWYVEDNTEEKREFNFNHYFVKAVKGCNAIGSKNLVIHPLMPLGLGREDDYDFVFETNYKYWKRLLPIAKDYGVTLCFENMPFGEHAINTPESTRKFVDYIADDNFKICLDTGHANVFNLNMYDSVKICGDKLECLHMHDNNWNLDAHLYPYQGCINWDDFIRGMQEINFNGVYSLECCPDIGHVPKEVITGVQLGLAGVLKYIVSKIENK